MATPLVIIGVILSTLHQSSLGSLYLIVPSKLHPLWYTPLLPFLFLISAIGAGIGMTILESYLSGRAFGRHLEMDLLEPLARGMVVALGVYGLAAGDRHRKNGAAAMLLHPGYEARMFLFEMIVGVVLPVGLLLVERVRTNPTGLVVAAVVRRPRLRHESIERQRDRDGARGRHAVRAVVDGDHGLPRARGARLRALRAGGPLPAHLPGARPAGE